MIRGSSRRGLRRFTAVAGALAVAASGLALASSPANAAESAVAGQLVDATGNNASGYLVFHRQQADGTYDPWESVSVYNGSLDPTDVVEDGVYKIQFNSSNGYTEWYRDAASDAAAAPVTVAPGANLGAWTVEIPLVNVVVTDPTGRPIEDAYVRATDGTGSTLRGAYTNRRGLAVLEVGPAAVKVQVQGTNGLSGEWYADKATEAEADPVTGSPTGTPVAVQLAKGAGSISGVVTSDAGAPLEMVEVSAGGYTDYTDRSGVFVIEDVSPGNYKIEFYDPINEYVSEWYDNVSNEANAASVAVAKQQAVGNINATLTPKPPVTPAPTTELSGIVTDNLGVPVVGAWVQLYDTPVGGRPEEGAGSVRTNRSGVYAFNNLDGQTDQFKVSAQAYTYGEEDPFRLFDKWYGQKDSYESAAPVQVNAGTPVGGVNIVLPRAGGIAGSVTGVAGLALEGEVTYFDADGGYVGGTSTEADSTFEDRTLYPGTYKVHFSDNTGNHASEFWKDATAAKATTVTVKSGQVTGGLNAVLGAQLVALTKPEVKGYPWVGKSISVTNGTWNLMAGTSFTYEWLNGSTVVGTGPTFSPSKSLIGKRLTVRVTAENGRLVGSSSVTTAKVGYKPTIKLKGKGKTLKVTIKAKPVKAKKIKGKLIAKEIVKVKADGTIKYKKVGKAKVKKGKATLKLKLKGKGKHKVVIFFIGKGKVGSNDVTKKLKG